MGVHFRGPSCAATGVGGFGVNVDRGRFLLASVWLPYAPEGHDEEVAIRVRPASNPQLAEEENAAHFFSEAATSSFVIRRSGNRVMAAIYGRNEKPNIDTPAVADKIRNTAVAFAAMLGFSQVQWKSLARGLVST